MLTGITKPHIMHAMSILPKDATVGDAMESLRFLKAIDEGLASMRRGEGIPHAEVKRRMAKRIAKWSE